MDIIKKYVENLTNKLGFHLHHNFWEDDKEFIKIYHKIKSHTLLKPDKVYFLYKYAKYAKHLPGEVAEVGVYKGGSAKLAGLVFSETSKKIYIFDTFQGFQSLNLLADKNDPVRLDKKAMSDTSLKEVQEYLKIFTNITLCKGVFPDSLAQIPECRNISYSFVYIDVDIYQSTMDCLNFFYPRLVPGGILICDDYNSKKWGGVKRAVHEYIEKENGTLIQTTVNQAIILKCN